MAHVWLRSSSGEVLVRADRIYDITCASRDLVICAGPVSEGVFLTYTLVEGNSAHTPDPASMYSLVEAIAAAEASGSAAVISAEPFPEPEPEPESDAVADAYAVPSARRARRTEVLWTTRKLA